MRVLVTGSRVITPAEAELVRAVLRRTTGTAIGNGRDVVIVQGECPSGGVDAVASLWAAETAGVTSEGHAADWLHGKAGGPKRNTRMVGLGADICLAFPAKGSRGTWDCLRKAVEAGIYTEVYPLHRQSTEAVA